MPQPHLNLQINSIKAMNGQWIIAKSVKTVKITDWLRLISSMCCWARNIWNCVSWILDALLATENNTTQYWNLTKTSCAACRGLPPQYVPAPASGDLNSHPDCASWCCSSSYSICLQTLKFVVLPIPKIYIYIYPTFGHSADQAFDLSTCKLGHPSHGLPFCHFSASCALPLLT